MAKSKVKLTCVPNRGRLWLKLLFNYPSTICRIVYYGVWIRSTPLWLKFTLLSVISPLVVSLTPWIKPFLCPPRGWSRLLIPLYIFTKPYPHLMVKAVLSSRNPAQYCARPVRGVGGFPTPVIPVHIIWPPLNLSFKKSSSTGGTY